MVQRPAEAPALRLDGARVVLVSMANDITCVGLRSLAALLRDRGADCSQVYLPQRGEGRGDRWRDQLLEHAAGATLVGMSVLSIDAPRARDLSRRLRRAGSRVAWGGPFPSLRPFEALEAADWVCRGDGEDYLPTLVGALHRGEDPASLLPAPGDPSPLADRASLDVVPSMAGDGSWLLRDGGLVPMGPEFVRAELAHSPASRDTGTVAYETVSSRGCPHRCGFCGSTALKSAAPGAGLRWRSVDAVLEELHRARRAYPFITGVGFADDNFPARPLPELEAFTERYRVEVGLPFICLGSPASLTEQRLRLLKRAGLVRIKMGIQSGSARVQQELDRVALHAQLPRALAAIAACGDGLLPPRFDLLVDLPFQRLEDELETLRLVAELPRPFRLELNALRLMDGTPLHARAGREGWSTPDVGVSFKRIEPRYTNLLLALSRRGRLPSAVLRLAAHPALARPLSGGLPAWGLAALWSTARRRAKPGGA